MQIETIILDSNRFVQQQLERVVALGIEIQGMLVDNICIRVNTDSLYDEIVMILSKKYPGVGGEMLVGGRRFSVFDITDLTFTLLQNTCDTLLKVPAPKSNHKYPNGLQHIEIVYPRKLEELLQKHSHLNWNKDGFTKDHNRDLVLLFEDMSEVKFHEQSLREVLSDK